MTDKARTKKPSKSGPYLSDVNGNPTGSRNPNGPVMKSMPLIMIRTCAVINTDPENQTKKSKKPEKEFYT